MAEIRDKIIGFLYRNLLKRIFFLFDAESVHDSFIKFGRFLGRHGILKKLTAILFGYQNESLEQNILGIKFKNPVASPRVLTRKPIFGEYCLP